MTGHCNGCIIVVVSPLVAFMKDQVTKFEKLGLKCLVLGQDLVSSVSHLLYITPEWLLQDFSLRELFCYSVYNKKLVGLVVDEVTALKLGK